MFRIIWLLLLVLLSYFGVAQNTNDKHIITLPISEKEGFGPFSPEFKELTYDPDEFITDEWSNTIETVSGIPEDWDKPVVKRIIFDIYQFTYQNYKLGAISEDFFNRVKVLWQWDLTNRDLSEQPIRCYTHIVMHKTPGGIIEYKIDTNNNDDFSDDRIISSPIMVVALGNEAGEEYAPMVQYEAFVKGGVVKKSIPVLIAQSGMNRLLYSFPVYKEATFKGESLILRGDIVSTTFDKRTLIGIKADKENFKPIAKEGILKIDGVSYQNMGVDANDQLLLLGEKPSNKKRVYKKPNVGDDAIAFSGNEFTTNQKISLSDFEGKYLYLEFWGSWCGPCMKEIPNVKYAKQNLDPALISFLGIAYDRPAELAKTIKKKKITWPQILHNGDNKIADIYDVQNFPKSYLIDPDGKIIAEDLSGSKLIKILQKYINKRSE
ncbi:Peroxiredoxin [Zhouia amylolytica]|uniref:Peroxiredoxin n=1 Tax=Zhouia amylolytica TaxID=376730 RepID=A0A1I6SI26_9FLAO|nr:TlpA disulfide reductase family protein [Zhouia amylolytica]SFS76569.1 Peroxiredoxin [Zhouia amylolytica]